MTTSGVYAFNLTRNQIIRNALLKVGGIDPGEQPTNEQYTYCGDYLNMIIESLRGKNSFVWEMQFVSFSLTASSLVLGSDGNTYECIRNHTSSSATEPVTGSEYLSFWQASGTSTATPWADHTAYTSICNIPIDPDIIALSDLRMRQSNYSTIYMNILSREDYQRLSYTQTPGMPIQYYFYQSRTDDQSIFLYPYPQSTAFLIEGYVYKYPEVFETGNDTPSFRREWLMALVDLLAYQIAPIQGIFGQQLSDLRVQSEISLDRAQSADHEDGPVRIQPNMGQRRAM